MSKFIGPFLFLLLGGWVVADLVLEFSFATFAVGFVVIASLGFVVGRSRDRVRQLDTLASSRTSFDVEGDGLFITDDFNFGRGLFIRFPPGRYEALAESDGAGQTIESVTVIPAVEVRESGCEAATITVSFGLLYVVDEAVRRDAKLATVARSIAAGVLDTPVFETLTAGSRSFGVAVELGTGNGEYHVRPKAGSVRIEVPPN